MYNKQILSDDISILILMAVQLEGTLHLYDILDFASFSRLVGQHHLHFMAGRGNGDFVDLGKALADVHKRFIFGFREDKVEVERC